MQIAALGCQKASRIAGKRPSAQEVRPSRPGPAGLSPNAARPGAAESPLSRRERPDGLLPRMSLGVAPERNGADRAWSSPLRGSTLPRALARKSRTHDCIVPGCAKPGRNRLGVRCRITHDGPTPFPSKGKTAALFSPDAEAYLCDDHALGGAHITLLVEPDGSKRSNHNEGTRSLATNAVGICRQAGGSDGCCAVDRLGRVVEAGRAVVAEDAAALSLSRPEAVARSGGVAGNLVRAAHGHRLAASAAGAGLRERCDLLPALGRVAEREGVGAAACALAR